MRKISVLVASALFFILLLLSCQHENEGTIESDDFVSPFLVIIEESEQGVPVNFSEAYPQDFDILSRKIQRIASRNSIFKYEDIDFANYNVHKDSSLTTYT